MRKYGLLLYFVALYSCRTSEYDNKETIIDLGKSMNLVSPDGNRIASNINELKYDIRVLDFEIVEIKHLE